MRPSTRLLILVAAIGGCASPLPRWRISTVESDCLRRHRHPLLTNHRGVLGEFDPRKLIDAAWDQVGYGQFQITRGAGGWWVLDKGNLYLASRQIDGALWWIGDGDREFQRLAEGRYVGVALAEDKEGGEESILAVRSECRVAAFDDGVSYTIVERLTRTPSGWSAPVEVQRFGGVCPFNAIGDEQGRPLIVAWVMASQNPTFEVLRVEGDRLRSVGEFEVEYPNEIGVQIDRSAQGDLLLSAGYSRITEEPGGEAELLPNSSLPTLLLRWVDEDHLIPGWLVRSCAPTPFPSAPAAPTPLRALGVSTSHNGPLTFVDVRPDYTDLAAIVDHVGTLPPPVRLGLVGLDLRGQEAELLRLPAGTRLMLIESTSAAQWDALARERPDLFEETAWTRPADPGP